MSDAGSGTALVEPRTVEFLKDKTHREKPGKDVPVALPPQEGTPLKGYDISGLFRFVDITAPFLSAPFIASAGQAIQPQVHDLGPPSEIVTTQPEATRIERVNLDRLQLLARRFVHGKLSQEDEARLLVSSIRVETAIPRVTQADFDHLGEIAARLGRIGERVEERRTKFGLR